MRRCLLSLAVMAGTVFCVAPAQAQVDIGVRQFGIRGGLTIGPDQVHMGLHLNAGRFAPKVRFQPSFELGFGSDRVVGTINLDALYIFEPRSWVPYLGGGLGVSFIHRDSAQEAGDSDFDLGVGLNLIGGFEWGSKYLLEARVGVGDNPDFKLTVGMNF